MNPRPPFGPETARQTAREHYGIAGDLVEVASERDRNYRLCTGDGSEYVLKVANAAERRATLELQNAAFDHLARHHAAADGTRRWPRVHPDLNGGRIAEVVVPQGAFLVRLLDWLPGVPLAETRPHDRTLLYELGRFVGGMDRALTTFDHPAARRELQWDLAQGPAVIRRGVKQIDQAADRDVILRRLEQFERYVDRVFPTLPQGVIHNDANDYNVLVTTTSGRRRISAVIDLGDMLHSAVVGDLAITLAYAMMNKADPLAAGAAVVAGYAAERALTDDELDVLADLVGTRLAMSVTIAARQRRNDPENEYLGISERPAWDLLRRLDAMPRALPREVFRNALGRPAATTTVRRPDDTFAPLDAAALRTTRRAHLGPSLSLSYDEPLTIVRGFMQYLFDADGRRYLDCVNNVCHVGHCHPAVVEAARWQSATLNTNTRYLHPNLSRYAAALTSLFPGPLAVCYLVNSGSEANDLALRLARTFTGRTASIVIDGAYHGNLSSLVEISPYKFAGPGGTGPSPAVHVVPMPDPYRGRYRGPSADLGPRYARHVADATQDAAGDVAAFICESILGCGGQIVLPDGYLREAFRHVRAAGGVCIADEVQIGFGRVGSHRWGFESQGVTPDIVTLGKPIGNGHPLGAVITTKAIAEAFDNGMEYFNTYGGNPVSCAIGLAVLDAIEADGLQANARDVGAYLAGGLRDCASRHAAIGDVRGCGLFLGVELVRDDETRNPAPQVAHAVVQAARRAGVLLSTDGPDHNVIKIKPPLPFDRADADELIATLDAALSDVEASGLNRD